MAVADLNVPDSDTGACGLHAASTPGAEFSFGGLYLPPQAEGDSRVLMPAISMQSPLSPVLTDWGNASDITTAVVATEYRGFDSLRGRHEEPRASELNDFWSNIAPDSMLDPFLDWRTTMKG
jgi:hypothetical protein